MIDPTKPGTLLWLVTDSLGGNALLKLIRICTQHKGELSMLCEVKQWVPLSEEYLQPAEFVIVTFATRGHLPCPSAAAFVGSADCDKSRAVASDKASLQETEPSHQDVDPESLLGTGAIEKPGCLLTALELAMTGRSSRRYIDYVNKMRASAIAAVCQSIVLFYQENGKWPANDVELYAWLSKDIEFEYIMDSKIRNAVLNRKHVAFRAKECSLKEAVFAGAVMGLAFNEKLESVAS